MSLRCQHEEIAKVPKVQYVLHFWHFGRVSEEAFWSQVGTFGVMLGYFGSKLEHLGAKLRHMAAKLGHF